MYDLIIIGAGINGTGIARDAALRGLRVLLVDQDDLASGTSSRSARMIHGGLRYLEHRDVGLVWESLQERTRLLRIAPHLVRPQPLVIPFYRPNRHQPWQVKLGLATLDALATLASCRLGTRQILSRAETLRRLPGLNPVDLTGAGLMPDAYSEYGERLCVENALAAHQAGAHLLTHCPVETLLVEGNRVHGIRCRPAGQHQLLEARAPLTVNVAGPWVDRVLQPQIPSPPLIGGTKGSFLVVDPFPGAPADSCFFEALSDQRPMVVLPWLGACLIGTTDLRYPHDPELAVAEEAEVAYLLREANRAFPQANLTRSAIRYTYAGVRPLPYHPEGAPGSITRKHIVHDHAPSMEGLISIVGGKYSTFRSLAQETVDLTFRKLGRIPPPCSTATIPLPGAVGLDESFCARFRQQAPLPPSSIERLLRLYGTRGQELLSLAHPRHPELLEPFHTATGALGVEILFAVQREHAQSLVDVLLRRTMIAYESAFDPHAADAALLIAQKYLDWNDQRAEDERVAYRDYIRRFQPRTEMSGPAS